MSDKSSTSQKFRLIVDFLTETIPDIECVIIADKDGKILESTLSKQYRLSWITDFVSTISKRFPLDKFNTHLEGLEITVNFFKTEVVLVKMFENDHLLIVITSRNITSIASAMEGMASSILIDL